MKTKTTEIQYCADCPHCKHDKYIDMYCDKTGRKTGVLAIPSWCPLPDSHAPKLREALTRIVNCLETIKANSVEMEKGVDWFDWCFINQELERSKRALGKK